MPFTSLTDPDDLARAAAALEAAWRQIKLADPGASDAERLRLTYIVASLVASARDTGELVGLAIERYRRSATL